MANNIIKNSWRLIFPIILLLSACSEKKTSNLSESLRSNFNSDWQFYKLPSNYITLPADSVWKSINLPHTTQIEPKITTNQWQGLSVYRKEFTLPKSSEKKIYTIQFEGAMNVATVWINGTEFITHYGGYLPFAVDFSEVARVGKSNIITVVLDNRDCSVTGPKPMKALDFNMYGGLYRNVTLSIKNQLHITNPLIVKKVAGGGIFVTYPNISKESATVKTAIDIENSSQQSRIFQIRTTLLRAEKAVVTERKQEILTPQETKTFTIEMDVDNPALWSPKKPNLYQLRCEIIEQGDTIDCQTEQIGIRKFEIRNQQLYINGEHTFLRGVNRHQDYPYIGYALSDAAQWRDAEKIKSAGFDYVRLSHYPHSPAFMDACDALGLVTLDAILGWQYFDDNDTLFKNHIVESCHNLVQRDRNRASVLAWEVSLNESWMSEKFIDRLCAAAKSEFPGSYTAGWQAYGYDIFLQARQHRVNHYLEPTKPYIVSEYGDWEYYAMNAGFDQGVWGDLLQAERSSRQLLSAGEVRMLQQATNIQEAHNDNFNTPALGDGYWVMFDYNRGYADDLESSGIMSIDRLPKYSTYFFQSQRSADEISDNFQSGPMVKIASYWNEESPLDVRVFSNCEKVELVLNGETVALQTPDKNRISNNLAHPPFTFSIPKFVEGELKAIGYITGKIAAKDSVKTAQNPVAIQLRIDNSKIAPKVNCKDVVFVYAELIDAFGTVVPINNTEIECSISGDANILNQGKTVTEAGVASFLIEIGNTLNAIEISARSEDLKSEKLRIETH